MEMNSYKTKRECSRALLTDAPEPRKGEDFGGGLVLVARQVLVLRRVALLAVEPVCQEPLGDGALERRDAHHHGGARGDHAAEVEVLRVAGPLPHRQHVEPHEAVVARAAARRRH